MAAKSERKHPLPLPEGDSILIRERIGRDSPCVPIRLNRSMQIAGKGFRLVGP